MRIAQIITFNPTSTAGTITKIRKDILFPVVGDASPIIAPRGFAEMARLYTHYAVLGAKMNLIYVPTSATPNTMWVQVLDVATDDPPAIVPNETVLDVFLRRAGPRPWQPFYINSNVATRITKRVVAKGFYSMYKSYKTNRIDTYKWHETKDSQGTNAVADRPAKPASGSAILLNNKFQWWIKALPDGTNDPAAITCILEVLYKVAWFNRKYTIDDEATVVITDFDIGNDSVDMTPATAQPVVDFANYADMDPDA